MSGNIMPDLHLDDATRARMVWFAQQIGADVSEGINILMDYYMLQEKHGRELRGLKEILALRDDCGDAEVDVGELKVYMADKAKLKSLKHTLEDVPRAIEFADALAQASLTLESCARFLKVFSSLQAAKISLSDMKQLKKDIEHIRKLAGVDKKDIRELALYLAKVELLKKELKSLQQQQRQAKGKLEVMRRQTSALAEERNALQRESSHVMSEINRKEEQLAALAEQLDALKAKVNEHEIALQITAQFRQFLLSREVGAFDQFWLFVRSALEAKAKEGFYNIPLPPEFCEPVRKEIVRILQKIVKDDLVSHWDLDRWRRDERVKAAEILRDKHAGVVKKMEEALKEIGKGMEKLTGARVDLKLYIEKIQYPR